MEDCGGQDMSTLGGWGSENDPVDGGIMVAGGSSKPMLNEI